MYAHDVLDPWVSGQALSLYRACIMYFTLFYVISLISLQIMPHVSRLPFQAKLIKRDFFTLYIGIFFCNFHCCMSTELVILIWFYNTALEELNDMYIYLYIFYIYIFYTYIYILFFYIFMHSKIMHLFYLKRIRRTQ